MLKTIRENRVHALPMRIFEVSDVAFKDEVTDPQRCARNERHVTAVYADKSANFEIVHGLLDQVMRALGIPRISKTDTTKSKGYYLETSSDTTFFPGRAATIHYRSPPQAPVVSSESNPLFDSEVTSNITTQSQLPKEEKGTLAPTTTVTDALATTAASMGKALADILGGSGSQSSLTRRLNSIGGKGDIEIGQIGVLHPLVLSAFELDLPCSAMEFDLEVFL
jgi:phenylalanyl-tRNA synthetase beta chain